jgi:hypothetical protein
MGQPAQCGDPQLPVRRLRQRDDGIAGQPVFHPPVLDRELPQLLFGRQRQCTAVRQRQARSDRHDPRGHAPARLRTSAQRRHDPDRFIIR